MFSQKSKFRAMSACAVLGALTLAASCRGFFVNPTVTSLAIGPANLSLAPGTSYQMIATATYSDGSTGDVTGKSVWTSASPNVANFTSAGRLQAASLQNLTTLPGTTSVSASDGTVSSSQQTVNVCPVVQTMKLTVNNGGTSATVQGGAVLTFDVEATFNGVTGTTKVTNNVTWTISNTTALPSITDGSGTTVTGSPGTFTVFATLCGASSNTVSITTTT